MAKKITIPPSHSGYFKVELAQSFEHAAFMYKPGGNTTVNLEILEAMIAEGVVTSVVAA